MVLILRRPQAVSKDEGRSHETSSFETRFALLRTRFLIIRRG
jgi:hypothetical protein